LFNNPLAHGQPAMRLVLAQTISKPVPGVRATDFRIPECTLNMIFKFSKEKLCKTTINSSSKSCLDFAQKF
jgi:hypothetical protein